MPHPVSPDERERSSAIKLVGQLKAIIQDSGNPTNFEARARVARWLVAPLPAFGDARPVENRSFIMAGWISRVVLVRQASAKTTPLDVPPVLLAPKVITAGINIADEHPVSAGIANSASGDARSQGLAIADAPGDQITLD